MVADSYNTTIIGVFCLGYWFIAYCVTRLNTFTLAWLGAFYALYRLNSLLIFAIFVFIGETGYTQVTLSRFIMENLVLTLIFNTVLSLSSISNPVYSDLVRLREYYIV